MAQCFHRWRRWQFWQRSTVWLQCILKKTTISLLPIPHIRSLAPLWGFCCCSRLPFPTGIMAWQSRYAHIRIRGHPPTHTQHTHSSPHTLLLLWSCIHSSGSQRHKRQLSHAGIYASLNTCMYSIRMLAKCTHSHSRATHIQTIKDSIDSIRTLAVHVNSYGVVTSEEQARFIVKTHADLVCPPPPPR